MVNFVVTSPCPQVWLLAHCVVRDLTLECDPSALVGQEVALYSAPHGDHLGYRHLARMLAGTEFEGTSVSEVRAACPKRMVVGLARIASVTPVPHGFRVHLVEARAVRPTLLPMVAPEVWCVPRGVRREPDWGLGAGAGR